MSTIRISTPISIAIVFATPTRRSKTSAVRAADICKAIALHDTVETEEFPYALKRGEIIDAVSEIAVNSKTGKGTLYAHGGGYYPAEALRLTNCSLSKPVPGAQSYSGNLDDVVYDLEVIRSKVPPAQLRIDDVDNKLLEIGMCYACADHAARIYVEKPASRIARLVRQALEGNASAIKELTDWDGTSP
jgi:hypothetical protein